jgi:RNA polymerase sigma-70 factor (ECF subfamily)
VSDDEKKNKLAASAERAAAEYTNRLLRYCMARISSAQDRLDIVQDVLLEYVKSGLVFSDKAHERNWLFKVTDNKIADRLRRQYRRGASEIAEELVAETAAAANADLAEAANLTEALRSLPENWERVIRLYYLENFTTDEIAAYLKIGRQTVWNLLSKARERLREYLTEDE